MPPVNKMKSFFISSRSRVERTQLDSVFILTRISNCFCINAASFNNNEQAPGQPPSLNCSYPFIISCFVFIEMPNCLLENNFSKLVGYLNVRKPSCEVYVFQARIGSPESLNVLIISGTSLHLSI